MLVYFLLVLYMSIIYLYVLNIAISRQARRGMCARQARRLDETVRRDGYTRRLDNSCRGVRHEYCGGAECRLVALCKRLV